jgi:DNA-directed RNA polymerase subunit L
MAASYEFKQEDHTLGNALRYIIMKKYVICGVSSEAPTYISYEPVSVRNMS